MFSQLHGYVLRIKANTSRKKLKNCGYLGPKAAVKEYPTKMHFTAQKAMGFVTNRDW